MAKRSGKHPGGRPRHPEGSRRDVQIATRFDDDTVQRIDKIVARSRGLVERAKVMRAAAQLGLDLIELNPTVLYFDDVREQIAEVLRRHFGAEGMFADVDQDREGNYVVTPMPPGVLAPGGATTSIEEAEATQVKGRTGREVIHQFADRVPPQRPLPGENSGPTSAKPRRKP
jgi:hypothetical protein